MTELEGVIKYRLEYTERPALITKTIGDLNAWRCICHRLHLIGQDPERYQGYGYGNISQRISLDNSRKTPGTPFIISGTQTGTIETLSAEHYCRVLRADITRNLIVAEGPLKPSSEALTHAAVYDANSAVQFIIHVHSPEIWNHSVELGISSIADDIAYGTPQMAGAVRRLFQSAGLNRQGIFAMLGHQDGVITFGNTARQAGQTLIDNLALALRNQLSPKN